MKRIVFVLILLLATSILSLAFAEGNPGLYAYFLDVGQGDATVIVCDGEVLMIDGGPSSASQFIYSFLRNTLQINHIDVMIATHPHADHVGGLSAALNACVVDVLYTSEINYDTKAWQSVLKYADAQGTPVVIPFPGDFFEIGGATVEILGPLWYHNSLNDLSLIIKVTYGDTSLLITGDAEWEAEHDLLDAGVDVSANVLRVGHHGSNTSTSYQFLRAVAPQYGIISVGKDNTYGHPDEETLSRLEDADVIVMRTDQLGTIVCYSNGTELIFSSMNSKGEMSIIP